MSELSNLLKNTDFEHISLEDLVALEDSLLAKKSGRSISFGEIKSPEFKARLMLACLENDVKMKNIPTFTELKDIEPTTMKQINDKLKEISNREKGATQETNTQGSQQATTRKPTVAQILNSKGFSR